MIEVKMIEKYKNWTPRSKCFNTTAPITINIPKNQRHRRVRFVNAFIFNSIVKRKDEQGKD